LTASLAISGVLLLAMAVTAGYAIVTLPRGARVPVNAGTPEHSVWLSTLAGLAVWLAAGAVAFAALESLTRSGIAVNWATSMRVTLPPAVLSVVLAGEAAAVITARQAAAPARAPAPVPSAEPSSGGPRDGLGSAGREEQPAAQGARGGAEGDQQPRGQEQREEHG
jgi:hypothetical protein